MIKIKFNHIIMTLDIYRIYWINSFNATLIYTITIDNTHNLMQVSVNLREGE